ncbi:Vesicle-associated protein 2-1 [Hibiscus syriacus]|uniref:Vesicle-associated protein 2-1 n=1 Tax=Hibiscus syriacus TaxID=106335 RepID=A0A6A2XSM3_HIBSY|nr:Vesicle-associated protein 2-1 [Hibiscus syriacus]
MTADGNSQLISVQPNGLKFAFELEKPSFCDLKVVNNTDHHVAFKVKTTSPKKYFVRPNTGVVQPLDSSVIRVTLQAQREYPPDMQCKDKFLLQSTVVPPNTDVDDLPADTFNKESTREIQECKLKVFYVNPSSRGNSEDEGFKSYPEQSADSNSTVRHLKDERDTAVRQTLQLQQELDFLKRRRQRRNDSGFSLMFAFVVGLIGILVGFLLNLSLSSSPLPPPPPSSPFVDSSIPPPSAPPSVD